MSLLIYRRCNIKKMSAATCQTWSQTIKHNLRHGFLCCYFVEKESPKKTGRSKVVNDGKEMGSTLGHVGKTSWLFSS